MTATTTSYVDGTQRPSDGPPGAGFVWVDLTDPSADELAAAAARFGLHDLAVEDTEHFHQRTKLDRYDEHLFLAVHPAGPEQTLDELHTFVGPDFVVTAHRGRDDHIKAVRDRLEADESLLAHGPAAVVYGILDHVVDSYLPRISGLDDDIDDVEDAVFGENAGVARRIYDLSRQVVALHRVAAPLHDVLVALRGHGPARELDPSFRDVADHVTKVVDRLGGHRDLLTQILQVNATLLAERQNAEMERLTRAGYDQNEQMKRISSWAGVLFAPTLVAGIYGMNFIDMPELHWALGYPYALGLMVVLALVLYSAFKHRGWL
jgi:magnesium transporter